MNACNLIGGRGGVPTAEKPGYESSTTGLAFNDEEGGFQVNDFRGQPDGPNLIFIEGGRTVLGSFEEDVMNARNNLERAVTVASFYMDETEVANIHWLEYEYYIRQDSDEYYWKNNIPDTSVWAKELAFNDPYVSNYYRYPGYRYFPVVGVNWRQAINYCKWRTKVVNQKLAEDAGLLDPAVVSGEDAFAGAEDGDSGASAGTSLGLTSGVVLPEYRLPTEAEWEYAAQALIGTQWLDENQTHRRLYPWDGHALRNPYGRSMGYFLANFKRGRGDYAGIAGKLNDGAMITTYIYDYPPNDFGLYNMAGNVNEWVQDVYRPLSFFEMDDLNPARRDATLDNEEGYDKDFTFVGNEVPYAEEDWIKTSGLQNSYNADNPPIKRLRVYKGGSWTDV
ncbi:MAG: gliding motility lipoprotein GldJ, partial [Ekhidna sp.]|nr:gliding motility lipoprotein GldJ [Ekhidna sp.]